MFEPTYIETVCLEQDSSKFEQLGFIREDAAKAAHTVAMINTNANCAVIPTMIALGSQGVCFRGYVTGYAGGMPAVIAADGSRCAVALALHVTECPVAVVREDGSLGGYESAIEYLSVLATVEERFRAARRSSVAPAGKAT